MNADCFLEHYERIADVPDAVSRLRRFILDLAVRGKLVQQESSDEPASELLDRIAKDKRDFHVGRKGRNSEEIAAGKFVELLDHEFLPSGWECVAFGNLVTELATGPFGSMLHQTDYVNDGIPVINPSHMIGGEIVPESRVSISREKAEQLAAYRLSPGDIVLARRGEVGRAAIVREVAKGWICGTGSFYVKLHKDLDRRFLMIVLEAPSTRSYLVGASVGTTMTNLNHGILRRLLVCVPPPEEQKRISAKVLELMGLCDHWEAARAECEAMRDRFAIASFVRLNAPNHDAANFINHVHSALESLKALTTRPDQIKHLRQTILNLAVRGKLVPQNPNDEPASELLKRIRKWNHEAILRKQIRAPRKPLKAITENEKPYLRPNGWEWARLGEIIYIQSGDALTAANMQDGEIPVFGGNGINGYHDKGNVDQQTIVIGRVGYYCGSIHVTPLKAWITDNAFSTHFDQDAIDLRFLVLLLKGTNLKADENATAQPVISGSKIYPIVVGLPPFAEQHRIVSKVDELMALCDRLETSVSAEKEIRSCLLDALLAEALVSIGRGRQDDLGTQTLVGHFQGHLAGAERTSWSCNMEE